MLLTISLNRGFIALLPGISAGPSAPLPDTKQPRRALMRAENTKFGDMPDRPIFVSDRSIRAH